MTHTPEELAMARRTMISFYVSASYDPGATRHANVVEAAILFAIQATTEAAATWLERQELPGVGIESVDEHIAAIPDDLSAELREGAHLKGNPHDSI